MIRRVLKNKVVIRGRSFAGLPAELTFEPADEPGIFWMQPDGAKVRIDHAELVASPLHFLSLHARRYELPIVEHLLGCMYLLGMDRVCFIPTSGRLPFDGSAAQFFAGLYPALKEEGRLARYMTRDEVRVVRSDGRYLRLTPKNTSYVEAQFRAEYREHRAVTLLIPLGMQGVDSLEETLSSRALCRSRVHSTLCATFGKSRLWPHGNAWVQFPTRDPLLARRVMNEILRHRALDFAAVLAVAAPAGGCIVGTLESNRVGHEADIELLRYIRMAGFSLPVQWPARFPAS